MKPLSKQRNINLILTWVWWLVLAKILYCTSGKLFERCELGQVLLHNQLPAYELADWLCLAEFTSSYETNITTFYSTTNATAYGIYQINNKYYCADEAYPIFTNDCHVNCSELLDDDLIDDLKCVRLIRDKYRRTENNSFGGWAFTFTNNCGIDADTSVYLEGWSTGSAYIWVIVTALMSIIIVIAAILYITHRYVNLYKKYKGEEMYGPYVAFNDAKDLRHTNESIGVSNMVLWAYQIAQAMAYVASKKVVHGDLATRNILLKDVNYAKLTDFGLSTKLYNYEIYNRKKERAVPWRWLAPESLADNTYSVHSDVWSYGVTLWEMFTFAQLPYSEILCTDLLHELQNGHRLMKPNQAPELIYELMLNCWKETPSHRPSFECIGQTLVEQL